MSDSYQNKVFGLINLGYKYFFVILAFIITSLWFKENYLFATAEEGMPFYRPARTANVYSSVLYENGTGFVDPLILPRTLFFHIISVLDGIIPNYLIEKIVFTLLIITASYGMYLLSKKLGLTEVSSFIAGNFYFLNLYVMSQVWRRAIFSGIFVWAFLPLFTLLYSRWMDNGKYRDLFILIFISLIFSLIYTQPAFLFVIWLPAFLYFILGLIARKKHYLVRYIFIVIVWLISNLWWIYPMMTISNPSLENSKIVADKSLESLSGVSVAFPVSQILQLKQKYYFDSKYNPELPETSWGTWYEGNVPILISYAIFITVLIGWWKLRKNKYWLYLTVFALFGLFISKGTNPPFGYIFFKNLFYNLSLSQVLRNSYEKFGLVWLLPYSLFFGSGVSTLYNKIKNRYASAVVLGVFVSATMGVLVWPVWNGKLFEEYSWVKVPAYYEELNKYINSDPGNFRITVLPLLPSHGVALSWGYRGDDPGISLYDKPVISRRIEYPFYTEKFDELKSDFDSGIVNNSLLNDLNVKYVVLNKDIRWDLVGTVSVDKTEEYLNNSGNLEFVQDFGNLKLYKNPEFSSSLIRVEGESPPKYEYKNVGINKYEVNVSDVDAPYKLILKSNYSDFWKVKVDNKPITDHQVEYAYANSWIVDRPGSYTLQLYFKTWPWE